MATRFVLFASGQQTEALAYLAWADATPQNPFHPSPWGYCRQDIQGRWVVPFLGPPFAWSGVEYPEPAGGEAARGDGVLADSVTWPDSE